MGSTLIKCQNVCSICKVVHFTECSQQGYDLWRSDTPIQEAMPELSATEREQMISGLCPTCQDLVFKEAGDA